MAICSRGLPLRVVDKVLEAIYFVRVYGLDRYIELWGHGATVNWGVVHLFLCHSLENAHFFGLCADTVPLISLSPLLN